MNGQQLSNPVLAGYLQQVDDIRTDARSLTQDLSAAQFNWRPQPRRWSIGQCLEHLTLTVRLYPALIEAMIAESRERSGRGEPPYREGPFSRWFVRGMEPPPKLRVRTMRRVDPPADLDFARVTREFDAEFEHFAELIAAADGVSLVHGRTTSPFSRMFRFTLGQVFAINLAHARRHLWQARQVRRAPAFPAS